MPDADARADDGAQWRELIGAYPWPVSEAERVMQCESGGDPLAENGTSVGLMQINYPYHGYDAPDALFDPATNIAEAFRIWSDGETWSAWACQPW